MPLRNQIIPAGEAFAVTHNGEVIGTIEFGADGHYHFHLLDDRGMYQRRAPSFKEITDVAKNIDPESVR